MAHRKVNNSTLPRFKINRNKTKLKLRNKNTGKVINLKRSTRLKFSGRTKIASLDFNQFT